MNIINKILIKEKEKEYKKYIKYHKQNILRAYIEFLNCEELKEIIYNADIFSPLYDRVLKHDDSKYSKEEFDAYRKQYHPINEQEKRLNKLAFEQAWLHHWTNNDHHWQNRQYWAEEWALSNKTKLACLENVIDWLAMGYHFNNRPYEYYEKHKDEIKLPLCQTKFIEYLIYEGIDKKYIKR